ncbi:hypothetical protein PHK61_14620 [Actinomycetospora lutea]|uniref:hypothetical protein n=1 Tax=Actinomycetospora lutea TaxID=663604 RepID=UPI002366B178|nr:hypothetical protein [Actinomycetospora lutea]MDD7939655.1 hypothetical protein [Actinomycetospora lutea]
MLSRRCGRRLRHADRSSIDRGLRAEQPLRVHLVEREVNVKPSGTAPRLLLVVLVTVAVALTALSVVIALVRPTPPGLWAYVDVLEPYNLPTWFAATTLLLTSLGCLANGLVAGERGRSATRLWVGAATGAAAASLCTTTRLHTRLDGLARQVVGTNPLTTDWLLTAVVVGVLLAVPFALLARRLRDGRSMIIAVVTFAAGALGSELVGRRLGDDARFLGAVAEGLQAIGAALLLMVVVVALHATRRGRELRATSDLNDERPRDLAATPSRRTVWSIVIAITLVLSALSLAVNLAIPTPGPKLAQWVGYLDVNSEGNLPTWWSIGLLVTAAAAHLAAGIAGRVAGAGGSVGWLVTATILAGMSLDDMTSIHERVGDLVRPEGAAASGDPAGDFSFFWVVPGAGVALVIAIAVGLLALTLHGRPRRLLVTGLGVLFFFALGLEGVQGAILASGGGGRVLEVVAYHVEELGENLGALLLLGAATSALALRRRERGLDVRYTGVLGVASEVADDGPADADITERPTEAIPVVAHHPVTRP